jgi:hypothetical protein
MNSRRQAIALRERSFHFENLPADKYFVNTKVADPRFSRDSWTEVDVGEDHPTAEVEIVLEEGRTIRGQAVWDDGSPIRKAYIALVAAWPAGTSVDASDDGTFEIAGLRRDLDYSLEVQKQGVKQVFPLIADMDTYVVDGKPMFRIRMRLGNHVFGEDEAFFISWTQFDDPSSPTIKHHLGGEVAEISVPRGSFRKAFVWCSKGMGRSEVSFAPVVVDLTAVTGPDLYIDVEEGAVMKGRVVTEDGKALRGMEVRVAANLLGPETRKLTWSYCVTKASTNEHGEFAVMGLPLDPRLISVSVAETEGWKQAEPLEVESYGAPVTIVMTR